MAADLNANSPEASPRRLNVSASSPENLRARGLQSGRRRSLLDTTAGRWGLFLPMFVMHRSDSDIIEQVVNQPFNALHLVDDPQLANLATVIP